MDGLEISAGIQICGKGMLWKAEVNIAGGAKPFITFGLGDDNWPCVKNIGMELFVKVDMSYGRFSATYNLLNTRYTYPPARGTELTGWEVQSMEENVPLTDVVPVSGQVVLPPTYTYPSTSLASTTQLAPGYSTYGTPAYDSNLAGKKLVLFNSIQGAGSTLGDFGVSYMYFDGSSWSSPAQIADSSFEESDPVVCYLDNNTAIAVWSRNNDTVRGLYEPPEGSFADISLLWSKWDGSTWTAPQEMAGTQSPGAYESLYALSSDAKLHTAWLAYLSDPDANLSTPDDSQVVVRTYDIMGWSTATAVALGVTVYSPLAIAVDNGAGLTAWSEDGDDNWTTENDRDIKYCTLSGAVWSTPTGLGGNTLYCEDLPMAVSSGDGEWALGWVHSQTGAESGKENNLTTIYISYSGVKTIAVASCESCLYPTLASDDNGNLIAGWHDWNPDDDAIGQQFEFRYVDASWRLSSASSLGGVVSNITIPVSYTSGRSYQLAASARFCGQACQAVDVLYLETQYAGEGNESKDNGTKLLLYSLPLRPDIMVIEPHMMSVTLDPTDPSKCTASIQGEIWNKGTKACTDIIVRCVFANNGTLIGVVTIPSLQPSATAQYDFDVVANNLGQGLKVKITADPNGTVAEWDEANNEAMIVVYGPDLYFKNGYGYAVLNPGAPYAQTIIYSNIAAYSLGVEVALYKGTPSNGGTLIKTVIVDVLGGGTYVNVSLAGIDVLTSDVYFVINPEETVVETNASNNLALVPISGFPDVAIDAADYGYSYGSGVLSLDVQNLGFGAAHLVNVSIYDRSPGRNGTLLGSSTLGTIAALSSTSANVTIGKYKGSELYVEVSASNLTPEADFTNNIRTLPIATTFDIDLAIQKADVNLTGRLLRVNVHNNGMSAAQFVQITVSGIDGNGTFLLDVLNIDTIAPTSSASVQTNISLLWLTGLQIEVFALNDAFDKDTSNNQLTISVVGEGLPRPGADDDDDTDDDTGDDDTGLDMTTMMCIAIPIGLLLIIIVIVVIIMVRRKKTGTHQHTDVSAKDEEAKPTKRSKPSPPPLEKEDVPEPPEPEEEQEAKTKKKDKGGKDKKKDGGVDIPQPPEEEDVPVPPTPEEEREAKKKEKGEGEKADEKGEEESNPPPPEDPLEAGGPKVMETAPSEELSAELPPVEEPSKPEPPKPKAPEEPPAPDD